MALGERRHLGLGQRVVHAAAGTSSGRSAARSAATAALDLAGGRAAAGRLVHDRLEELVRVVVGLGLHVLGQGDERRAAVGRVEQRGDRLGQRRSTCSGRVMRSQ